MQAQAGRSDRPTTDTATSHIIDAKGSTGYLGTLTPHSATARALPSPPFSCLCLSLPRSLCLSLPLVGPRVPRRLSLTVAAPCASLSSPRLALPPFPVYYLHTPPCPPPDSARPPPASLPAPVQGDGHVRCRWVRDGEVAPEPWWGRATRTCERERREQEGCLRD